VVCITRDDRRRSVSQAEREQSTMNGYDVPRLYNRPYQTYPMLEAAGAAAGTPQDASRGMPVMQRPDGSTYAFNATMGEWEYVYRIKSGDTLFNLSGTFYGTKSLAGVHAIYNVPQNKAIQGPSADSGLIPGDIILIPGLAQPSPAPAAADSIPSSMPQVPAQTTIYTPTSPGSPLPVPVPSSAPSGWPATIPYPPVNAPSGTNIDFPSDGSGGDITTLPTVQVVGNEPGSPTSSGGFWTGGRIALAAGAGIVGLGTLAYLATRKKRRRAA
jgi:hypothetical protein